ncbi:zinc finger BED domain-containing protein DAYSLEEPER-like [Capsicum annuum]|uniref:zinc finger BED domain-containing protein DAYSLEEPER-like n=1 Tax=Capsicum annuum TaxID=4072 RepID=UPI001FB116C1|nr:zinc finger BED domain-containing protein DAYSLEEPER-like [Capsicum annuum]
MAKEMEIKFKKYRQEDYSPIASMALVLDPRYKLKLVSFCFTKCDPVIYNEKVKVVKCNMHALFREYLKNSSVDVDMVESSSGRDDIEVVDEMDEYDTFESQSELSPEKTQLDFYLEEPVLVRKENEDLDVLKFWKDNRIKYSKLSLMARDLLSIPITTVVSESAFSIGGRVIGKYQSSIFPENAEAKLCSRD